MGDSRDQAHFREPRSRFPGACGVRDLRDLACLPSAGLYERPAPARVPERVRLPLASRPGVDKPVHGQRISIMRLIAYPHHVHSLTHTPAVNAVLLEQGQAQNAIQRCYQTDLFFKIVVSKLKFSSIR